MSFRSVYFFSDKFVSDRQLYISYILYPVVEGNTYEELVPTQSWDSG